MVEVHITDTVHTCSTVHILGVMAMAYSFEQAGKTKWRVQLNRKGIKVNKVFADELEAKNYEKKIIEEINKGIGKNSIDLENLEPDLRTLFEDYYN